MLPIATANVITRQLKYCKLPGKLLKRITRKQKSYRIFTEVNLVYSQQHNKYTMAPWRRGYLVAAGRLQALPPTFFYSGSSVYTSPLSLLVRSRINLFSVCGYSHNYLDPSRTVEAFIAAHLWDARPEWKTLQQEIGECSQRLSTLCSVQIHLSL